MTPLFVDQNIINRIKSARSLLAAHHYKLTGLWPLIRGPRVHVGGRTDEQRAAISAVLDAIQKLDSAKLSIETANINLAKAGGAK